MPSPQALAITLSQRQQSLLEQMVRRTTNAYRLVRRAQLVLLAAQGADNTEIGQRLQLSRSRVRLWRQRWMRAVESLDAAEAEGISDEGLRKTHPGGVERSTASWYAEQIQRGTDCANRSTCL